MKRYIFHTKPLELEMKVFVIEDAKGEYIKLEEDEKVIKWHKVEKIINDLIADSDQYIEDGIMEFRPQDMIDYANRLKELPEVKEE